MNKIMQKKHNARIYPIYKMFSWDLLFYYAISFVFLVQVKNLSPAMVMFTDALYPLFKIINQIPATVMIDKIGKVKSLIFANIILAIYLIIMIFANNIGLVILSYFIMAIAFSIKNVAEGNLLYDSVTSRNGKGMYSKLEEIGARNYYYLDGITSMLTGFTFVINGYLPMIISLIFVIISIIISTRFKEIYKIEEQNGSFKQKILDYKEELTTASKFIFQSKRLQAIMVFVFFFNGIIYISYTLRESLLTEINISPEFFAIIISTLTIISGIAAHLQEKIHGIFRNRALTFMAIIYVSTFLLVGLVTGLNINWFVMIALTLALFAIQYAIQSPYSVLRAKYLKSFATVSMRTKIDSTYNVIESISQSLMAFISSYFLTVFTVRENFILTGVAFGIILFIVLIWMRDKFGLKPEQYNKKDIEYEEITK